MNNKKGISPLIATVLIVGFTIVLAVLVITWISGTVSDTTSRSDCQTDASNTCLAAIGNVRGAFAAQTGMTNFVVTNEGATPFIGYKVAYLNAAGTTLDILPVAPTSLAAYASTTAEVVGNLTVKARIITTVHSDKGNGCDLDCAAVEVTRTG